MKKLTRVWFSSGDWEAWYDTSSGRYLTDGHSCNERELLEALGYEIEDLELESQEQDEAALNVQTLQEIIQLLEPEQKKYLSQIDTAIELAMKYHEGQKYDEHDYMYHLTRTAQCLVRFGYFSGNVKAYVACWNHDILEDTPCTPEDLLKAGISQDVVDIVVAVTDPPGKNRKERKAAAYKNIAGFKDATLVKLCDRIANVEHNQGNSRLFSMYKKEHPDFKAALYREGEFENLWSHLDCLLK